MNTVLKKRISFVSLMFIFCFAVTDCVGQSLQKFTFTQSKMGSPFTITFYATENSTAIKAATKAFHLVDSLNNIFSDYEPGSELNQLSATAGKDQWITVSPDLFKILQISERASIKSFGTFDITIGPVVKLWRIARKENRLPSDSLLKEAMSSVGFHYILLESSLQKVKLVQQGMSLDLGGIAKGFIAQSVIDFLKTMELNNAMVDAGGDIVMSSPPPGKNGWVIGINAPEKITEWSGARLSLKNMAVATSGDIYQFLEIDGKKYSHIVNPKTGVGITNQRNVTVIANTGELADWLATACSLLSIKKAMRLIKLYPGSALLIMENRNNNIKTRQSKSFKKYVE